ncbi:MAG: tRNA pseudouridine(38-40) synthase TruA [Oscillospiraceae bacterium]|nr:tRNA pseudouridine(38-40) synthase TruA [Oscillospiraceae bacterium]
MYTYRLTLSYDGSRYNGWQKQGNTKNTIQEKLETLLSRLTGEEVEVNGSGRTDAGVHAMGQVASFRTAAEQDCEALLRDMRRYLPEDIGAVALEPAEPRFHARLNATGKTYVYRVWTEECPNVFERKFLYTVTEPLDLAAMRAAAEYLTGTHDFMSFCANKRMKKSTVRTITALRIDKIGGELRFTVSGDGFLYNMVRILVGTLLEVGMGKRSPDSIPALLDAKDRSQAGYLVPPHGLRLEAVYYN